MSRPKPQALSEDLIRITSDPSGRMMNQSFAVLSGPQISDLSRLAIRHGLAPIFYTQIMAYGYHERLDDTILSALKENYFNTIAHNTRLLKELEKISVIKIPFVFLKGMALLPMLYKDIALRPMSDIDILCDKQDFKALVSELNALGYEAMQIKEGAIADKLESKNDKGWKTLRRGKTVVDLHSRIIVQNSEKALEGRTVIKAAQSYQLNGNSMSCPSREMMLFHLILHIDKHLNKGVTRYSNLTDILLFIKQKGKDLDKEIFETLVHSTGSGKIIYPWLNLLEVYFKVPCKLFSDKGAKNTTLETDLINWLQDGERKNLPVLPPWQRPEYSKLSSRGLKIKYSLSVFFPRISYIQTHYRIPNTFLAICYYPIRIISHTMRYLLSKFRKAG